MLAPLLSIRATPISRRSVSDVSVEGAERGDEGGTREEMERREN